MNVRIDICCNDPDNGLFAGRAMGIQLQDTLLELAALDWDRGYAFAELQGRSAIRLAGKTWPIVSSKDWFGNWCWNASWMDEERAADFLVWLHGRHLFSADSGESRLFNMWKKVEPFDADDREFIHRQLVKAALAEQRV